MLKAKRQATKYENIPNETQKETITSEKFPSIFSVDIASADFIFQMRRLIALIAKIRLRFKRIAKQQGKEDFEDEELCTEKFYVSVCIGRKVQLKCMEYLWKLVENMH